MVAPSGMWVVNADIGLFTQPGTVDGVWVTWGKALVKQVQRDVLLEEDHMADLALHLSKALPT